MAPAAAWGLALGLAVCASTASASASSRSGPGKAACPGGMTVVDTFDLNGTAWTACEDLQQPGGSIALVPGGGGAVEWFTKTHEVHGSAPTGSDEDYYLNLTKEVATTSTYDILGIKILSSNYTEVSWSLVESAVPPIRNTGQVRGFVGSRGSAVDATFSDDGSDAAGYGFPPALSYVFNLTNIAQGGRPLQHLPPQKGQKGKQPIIPYINSTLAATGLVGGNLPIVVYYFPVIPGNPFLPNATAGAGGVRPGGSRYWKMVASGAPDMQGSREQTVWFQFQQIVCASGGDGYDYTTGPCEQVGPPQYWDTMWWTNV